HGSIAVELGDTYSAGSAGGNDAGWHRAVNPDDRTTANLGGTARRRTRRGERDRKNERAWPSDSERPFPGGAGWPMPKSLCAIPQLYAASLAYGRNLLTDREIEPWRVRNIVRWCRPNPPVGALGDRFRTATSEIIIACKSASRFFDG